jgi:acetyl-CoA carboxylase biotin carboxyl carrier protein
MGLTPGDIQALLDLFEASTWQEMTIDSGEDHLHVSRRAAGVGSVPVAPPAPAETPRNGVAGGGNGTSGAPPAAAATDPTAPGSTSPATGAAGVAVPAPSVGLFWRAPAPGAPPFVEVGSRVAPDDTIAIIEVMKLMSPLKAGLSGVVTAILAENGATVARGEPLVLVDPDA